jgi:glutathione S-transferase
MAQPFEVSHEPMGTAIKLKPSLLPFGKLRHLIARRGTALPLRGLHRRRQARLKGGVVRPARKGSQVADELVFYTHPMSRGRIVRWMLEEIGRPYRTELLEYGTTMKAPAYLAVNPMGKVPALRHGDSVVTEAAAICAYLADAFPEARLAPPPGDRRRGPYYRWLFFGAGPLEAAWTNRTMGFVVPPERERMSGYGRFEAVVDILEAAVSRAEYVVGDSFTAVDVYLGSGIGFGMQFGVIEKRPAFEQYCQRLLARPAAMRGKEIDDALAAQPAPPSG